MDVGFGWDGELSQAAKPVELTSLGAYRGAGRRRPGGGQVPGAPGQRAAAGLGALVVGRFQPRQQAGQALLDLGQRGLACLAGLRQPDGRQREVLQAEDRGEEFVQARGDAEECFQLAVGEERAVVGEGRGPAEAFDAGLLLACDLRRYRGPGEVRARRPDPLHLGRAGAFDDELCRDPRLVRAVHAAPALSPDGRQLFPASQVPGEQHFECLGKA